MTSADEHRQRGLIVRAVVVSLTGIAVLWLIVAAIFCYMLAKYYWLSK